MSNEEFVNGIKDEFLNSNIYCFTPKGDVIELPIGATPLDFAYKIHTKVGESTVGAIVNNNIVPLDYELQNNDIVKINTSKGSTPSKEWLNIAKCSTTKNKIKGFFTKNDREIYIERGKYSLEKELRKRKISFNAFLTDENIEKICSNFKLTDLDDIYLSIGNGRVTIGSVINVIYKEEDLPATKIVKMNNKSLDADIIVSGLDKVKVNLANCCKPVYGDEIVGYITRGNGISVHRINCHNLEMLEDRTVEVSWNDNTNKKYSTYLVIYAKDNKNRMLDLVQMVSILNVSVDDFRVLNREDKFIYEMNCYVTGIEQLNKLLLALNKCDFIDKVERVIR